MSLAVISPLEAMLDVIAPMHLHLDADGRILHAGPTLTKLRPGQDLVGQNLFDVLDVQRPQGLQDMARLQAFAGTKLHLRFLDPPYTTLKAVIAPYEGGAVMHLSLGISILDAVKDYRLTASDFSPTDLAIEMLYLFEAKSAAMEASQRLNTRLQGAMIAAEEQAFTDTLTGLKNRRAMNHVLQRLLDHGIAFSLMHLDLDYFKQVNDSYGHAAGDHVLQEVSRIMVELTRKQDTVARVGGDEFVLVLRDMTDRAQLKAVADRLIGRLQAPICYRDQSCWISASIGIARSVDYVRPQPAQMLEEADRALYRSKRGGRGQHHFSPPERTNPDVKDTGEWSGS